MVSNELKKQKQTKNNQVSCATTCVDKYRKDCSCNSIMYVRETKECHLGKTTLAIGQEDTEYVYMISGENLFCCYSSCFIPSYKGAANEEYGVVYHGPSFEKTWDIPSSKACAQRCADSEQCNFWLWRFSDSCCSLKPSMSHKEDVAGHVSGNKP